MARKPTASTPREPTAQRRHVFAIYQIGKRQKWLTTLEAESESAAIEIVAKEFRKWPSKLIAIKKR